MISLVGYEWKAAQTKQVAYLATDRHIHELYVPLGGNWAHADLTGLTGAPLASGGVGGYEWDARQSKQVVYTTADGHIHELYVPLGGKWAHADLTGLTGAPPAFYPPAVFAGYQWIAGKTKQVAFLAGYGGEFKVSVRELYVAQGESWLYHDLSNLLSGPLSAGAPITGYGWDAGKTKQVAYMAADGHIHELYVPLGGSWAHADWTQLTSAPLASGGIGGYEWDAGQSKQVVYTTADGHIHELYVPLGGKWAHADLTQRTSAPPVSYESFLAAYQWDAGKSKQVVYMTADGHIHELYVPLGGSWAHADLTGLTGAPPGLGPSILAGYQWTAGVTKQVVYGTPDGDIHELYLPPGGSWKHADLTKITSGPPLLIW